MAKEQPALTLQGFVQGETDPQSGGGELPAEVWRASQQPNNNCTCLPVCMPGYTATNADINSDKVQLLQWVVGHL